MNCVPDFETDDDYPFPASTGLIRPKKLVMADEDIMELIWQNGEVVMQCQNQRSGSNKKPETTPSAASREIRSPGVVDSETTPSHLFMQEEEMASWLHYPIDDNSLVDPYLYNNEDLLYSAPAVAAAIPPPPPPPPPPASVTVPSPRPPIPPLEAKSSQRKPLANFSSFSRPNKGIKIIKNKISQAVKQPTVVVKSKVTPAAEAPESRASRVTGGKTFELSTTSSPGTGGSGASASVEPSYQKPPLHGGHDRKRKGIDTSDDAEWHSEDLEFEYMDAKNQSHGSKSKRTRAAEVHNLSERRRRDRINEKMKALQELIPLCNKSDKASMLDDAIEYLKSLQMQVQMMSTGYGVVPMMFPGVQQYMPPMAMGMGMSMDMNPGLVPYPTVLPGPARFPVHGFHMPPVPVTGPARTRGLPPRNPSQPRFPNLADPYRQHFALHQRHVQLPQSETSVPPVSSEASSNKDATNSQGDFKGK